MKMIKRSLILILLLSFAFIPNKSKAQTIPDDDVIDFSKQLNNGSIDGKVIGSDNGLTNCTVIFDNANNKNINTVPYFDNNRVTLSYGNTITVKGNSYNIKKISIEFSDASHVIEDSCLTLSSGEYESPSKTETSWTWTGDEKDVIFFIKRDGVSHAYIGIKSLKISYGDKKNDADLSFETETTTFSIFENEKVKLPTLKMAEGYTGKITYISSDENVATVNEDASIRVVSPGKTVITAVGQATETYNGGRCSLNLEIKRIVPSGCVLYESFNDYNGEGGHDGLWSGTLYNGITTPNEDNNGWSFTDNDSRFGYKCAIIGRTDKSSAKTPEVELAANKTYILKFKAAAWNTTNEQTKLNLTPKGILNPSTVELTRAKFNEYSVSLSGSGQNTKITFSSASTSSNKSRFFLDDVQIIDPNITVSSARYTVCITPMDIDFTKTPDITAYKVTEINPSGIVLTKVTKAPAKTPLIIEADAGTYILEEADAAVAEITDNLLLPANGVICGDGSSIYSLANINGNVGFYKVGSGVKIPLGKAYIVLQVSNAKEYMPFIGGTSNIHTATREDRKDSPTYNLQGIMTSGLSRGIYIRNGKKIIFKQ